MGPLFWLLYYKENAFVWCSIASGYPIRVAVNLKKFLWDYAAILLKDR